MVLYFLTGKIALQNKHNFRYLFGYVNNYLEKNE